MFIRIAATVAALAATAGLSLAEAPQSNAKPSNGSLLVPGDITPGYYWANPTDSVGGYVEVCSDLVCDVSSGMIENYIVDGRTMISVPYNARMVNVDYVSLTPAAV